MAQPDRVEVLAPRDCGGCGLPLADVTGRVTSRIQVFDNPPVKLQVTEYQLMAVTCPGCSAVTRAAAPQGMAGPCCYGPNVRAATALLACNGHMSIERAAETGTGRAVDIPATPSLHAYRPAPRRSGASPSTSPSRSPTTPVSSRNGWSSCK